MRIAILLILLSLSFSAFAEEQIVFFGKAKSQKHIAGVEQVCPEDAICMNVFYKWTIRVDKVVSGKLTNKLVVAARLQHGEYIYAKKHKALYVISRIDSEEKRKLFGAEYWLEEYAPPTPRVLYCVSDASKYKEVEDSDLIRHFGGSNCFYHRDRY